MIYFNALKYITILLLYVCLNIWKTVKCPCFTNTLIYTITQYFKYLLKMFYLNYSKNTFKRYRDHSSKIKLIIQCKAPFGYVFFSPEWHETKIQTNITNIELSIRKKKTTQTLLHKMWGVLWLEFFRAFICAKFSSTVKKKNKREMNNIWT